MTNGESSYRRYISGDRSGFDDIIDLYHDQLICFIYTIVKNESDAEDIAADTFVEILMHPRRYSFKSFLKTYIFSIARHKAIDFFRKQHRHISLELFETLKYEATDDETNASACSSFDNGAIKTALEHINRDYAEALYLMYFEELDIGDIGRIMKKTKKQVSNLVYRAKAAMKTELDKEGFLYDG